MSDRLSYSGRRWIVPSHIARGADLVEVLRAERGLNDAQLTIPQRFREHAQEMKAVIETAIRERKQIGIFGDYDCDGVTSTALLIRFFRRHGIRPFVRLPHRVHDGYGIQCKHVEAMAKQGVQLLITVDTGVSAHEPIALARKHGMDVLVLDHHHVADTLPEATSILHPALFHDMPEPHPAAAGVTYLAISCWEQSAWEDRENDQILSMIGTIADVVPLRGINRTLVREGLEALQSVRSGPLAELANQVRLRDLPLGSIDVAFRIAPRINAAGRLGDPILALRALLEGGTFLAQLEQLNRDRQERTEERWEHLLEHLDTSSPLLSAIHADYEPGIVGLLAGRLTERFGKPSLVGHINGDRVTASLRSTNQYDIAQGLHRQRHHLLSYGGHAQAGGCTFACENAGDLLTEFAADIAERVPEECLVPTLQVDAVLNASDVSLDLLRSLQSLQPFGEGNTEPLFLLRDVQCTELRRIGNDATHLKFLVDNIGGIGFGKGSMDIDLQQPSDILCRLSENTWNGSTSVQLQLVDARTAVSTSALLAA